MTIFNPGQYTQSGSYPTFRTGQFDAATNLSWMMDQFTNSAREAALQDRAWTAQREDTAVQRHMADLKAAGLNPWLAVSGQGAASSASGVASSQGEAMQNAASALQVIKEVGLANNEDLQHVTSAIKNVMKAINPIGIG